MSSSAIAIVVFGDVLLIFIAVILGSIAIRELWSAAIRHILPNRRRVVPAIDSESEVSQLPQVPPLPDISRA